jgi:hypothetical protein
LVEDPPEAQLIEQGADEKDRPPVRGINDLGFGRIGRFGVGLAGKKFAELGKDLDQQIFATEIGDDALLDLTVFSVGLDEADVFVHGTAGGADFDGSRVHENQYHDEMEGIQLNSLADFG